MKRLLLAGVSAVALSCAAAGAAMAEDATAGGGWYLSVFAGAGFLQEYDVHYSYTYTTGATINNGISENDTNPGFIVGLAAGAEVMPHVRAEVEASYSRNTADTQVFPTPPPAKYQATGQTEIYNILGNAWYDIGIGAGFSAYAGGGAGIGIVDARSARASAPDEYDDTDVGFAFQGGAGLRYAIDESLDVDLGYRYRGVLDVTLDSEFAGQSNRSTDIFGHFVQLGLTAKLGGP
jgi:OOP family OmpA-OmpF porin